MKRKVLVVVLMIGCLCSTLRAQHFVGAMVDGAVALPLDKVELTYPLLGGGASVGGVYQLQYDKLLLQTGLGVSQVWLRNGLEGDSIVYGTHDNEGYAFTYHGEVYNRTHQAMVTEVMVPFMLGTKVRSVHVLVGAKLALTVIGFTTLKAQVNTWGNYGDRYYGVLAHMPQHGFYDGKEFEYQDRVKFRPDVRLCAEVGYSWALTKEPVKTEAPVLQVGAFVEYGILNPLVQTETTTEEYNYSYPMDILKMNHIYTTLDREQTTLNNLRVGLRVAVLFPIAKGKNPFCFCLDGAATKFDGAK